MGIVRVPSSVTYLTTRGIWLVSGPCTCVSHAPDAVTKRASWGSQEAGLRTYLLAYGAYFHSLSLDQLCEMFELPEKQARPAPRWRYKCHAHAFRIISVWGRAWWAECADSQSGTCMSQPCLLQSLKRGC